MDIVKSDWVTTKFGGKGIVRRVAKDGSWADIDWGTHKKRMKTVNLIVQTTIPVGDGWRVTDWTRRNELEGFDPTESPSDSGSRKGSGGSHE
ncbi:hypothetical protein [Paenibacillus sp. FSL R7-0333]|uniref:hypothetical protein n=1 Tax=Paenibacillus sp. FSL R7-0333 TaxID=1926587 RepID=UPI00117C69DC